MNIFSLTTAFICYSFLIGSSAFGHDEVLAIITNDDNGNVSKFIANIDEENQSIKSFYKDDYINGSKTAREVLPADQLVKSGVMLDKRGDLTVINLKSDSFDFEHGGNVTIDTLFNGITGERKEYEIELAHESNGWKLLSQDNIISKLHIEVNKKMFLGVVGVKNIRME